MSKNNKIPRRKRRGKLFYIGLGSDCLDLTPKAKENKWDSIKLNNFHTAKETINKRKRQSIKWKKIFASHTYDKQLLATIYRELI